MPCCSAAKLSTVLETALSSFLEPFTQQRDLIAKEATSRVRPHPMHSSSIVCYMPIGNYLSCKCVVIILINILPKILLYVGLLQSERTLCPSMEAKRIFMVSTKSYFSLFYFSLQDVTQQIHLSPKEHYISLGKLIKRIQSREEAQNELQKWGLEIDFDIHKVDVSSFLCNCFMQCINMFKINHILLKLFYRQLSYLKN